jgi:hypothetical protein
MDENLTNNLRSSITSNSSDPDSQTQASRKSFYQDQYDAIALVNLDQNIHARRRYSFRIFLVTSGWLFSVVSILVFVGLEKLKLSDAVLIALLGTTTVNVLGFFVIVIQYLFNKDKST